MQDSPRREFLSATASARAGSSTTRPRAWNGVAPRGMRHGRSPSPRSMRCGPAPISGCARKPCGACSTQRPRGLSSQAATGDPGQRRRGERVHRVNQEHAHPVPAVAPSAGYCSDGLVQDGAGVYLLRRLLWSAWARLWAGLVETVIPRAGRRTGHGMLRLLISHR